MGPGNSQGLAPIACHMVAERMTLKISFQRQGPWMEVSGGPKMWGVKLEVTLHVEEAGLGDKKVPCVKI